MQLAPVLRTRSREQNRPSTEQEHLGVQSAYELVSQFESGLTAPLGLVPWLAEAVLDRTKCTSRIRIRSFTT